MTMTVLLILLGAGVGVGVTFVVAAFCPARQCLADLMARTAPVVVLEESDAYGQFHRRSALRLLRRLERCTLTAPATELDLIGRSRDSVLLQRLALALGGALGVPLVATIVSGIGAAPPATFTVGVSLLAAGAGWLLPVLRVRTHARAARLEFTSALASYFELVALSRQGDRGAVAALTESAAIGNGWAFARIRAALNQADLRGQMPWDGLRTVAAATGITELDDLGSIVTAAGQDGASIVDTLRSKAASMRETALATQLIQANASSSQMYIPLPIMGIALIVFMAFPGFYALFSS